MDCPLSLGTSGQVCFLPFPLSHDQGRVLNLADKLPTRRWRPPRRSVDSEGNNARTRASCPAAVGLATSAVSATSDL